MQRSFNSHLNIWCLFYWFCLKEAQSWNFLHNITHMLCTFSCLSLPFILSLPPLLPLVCSHCMLTTFILFSPPHLNLLPHCLSPPARDPHIIFNHLKPDTNANAKHQCLTHTSPSPHWGMWANVNLPQMWFSAHANLHKWPVNTPKSRWHKFNSNDISSMTMPSVQQQKPDDADSITTTQIQQPQHEFNNATGWNVTTMMWIWPPQP